MRIMKTKEESTISVDYSGKIGNSALKEAEEIAWCSQSIEEAWDMVSESDWQNEITSHVTFINE